MKGQILNIFRKEKRVISGETLSDQLGISRVSIWKHIKKLQELGYQIAATTKGYQLIRSPDALYPWEFTDRRSTVHFFDEIPSTMDVARDLARKNCPNFTVVIAGRQTAGRGRMQRFWLSSEGGLYFTIVLRPPIPPVLSYRINYAASMVLAKTIRQLYNIDAMVKWPNDILVNGKKIAGLLSEMEAESDRITYLNVGLGINVNNDPTITEPGASSLKIILGKELSRKQLLTEYLDRYEHRIINRSLERVVAEWKTYAATLNRRVKVVTKQETSEGLAVDVDENGALVLALDDGTIKKIIYGDCFH
ncbi:MAG: biotin--[acetyl-CoA-carboxylase] ligase [Desulfobacterales bacterium]|nr:MAG: biotin--[acetyl-CoA-carboxylase] ligase [Desulfobacterales bacterium]